MAAAYEADRAVGDRVPQTPRLVRQGLPGSADLRRRLHAVNSLDEVEGIFDDYLNNREAV